MSRKLASSLGLPLLSVGVAAIALVIKGGMVLLFRVSKHTFAVVALDALILFDGITEACPFSAPFVFALNAEP
jgi:hypothetical protein